MEALLSHQGSRLLPSFCSTICGYHKVTSWSKMAVRVRHYILFQAVKKREREKGCDPMLGELLVRSLLRSPTLYFHLQLTGQNEVTWPQLAREAGKYDLHCGHLSARLNTGDLLPRKTGRIDAGTQPAVPAIIIIPVYSRERAGLRNRW